MVTHPRGNKPGPASPNSPVSPARCWSSWKAKPVSPRCAPLKFTARLPLAHPTSPRPLLLTWEYSPDSSPARSLHVFLICSRSCLEQLFLCCNSFPSHLSVHILVAMVCVCNLEIPSSKPWLCHSLDMWPGLVTPFLSNFYSLCKAGVDNNHCERLLKDLMRVWKK